MDWNKFNIDINDDGIFRLSSFSLENIDMLSEEITSLIFDLKIGMVFIGKVVKLTQFGVFVNLIYKKRV